MSRQAVVRYVRDEFPERQQDQLREEFQLPSGQSIIIREVAEGDHAPICEYLEGQSSIDIFNRFGELVSKEVLILPERIKQVYPTGQTEEERARHQCLLAFKGESLVGISHGYRTYHHTYQVSSTCRSSERENDKPCIRQSLLLVLIGWARMKGALFINVSVMEADRMLQMVCDALQFSRYQFQKGVASNTLLIPERY